MNIKVIRIIFALISFTFGYVIGCGGGGGSTSNRAVAIAGDPFVIAEENVLIGHPNKLTGASVEASAQEGSLGLIATDNPANPSAETFVAMFAYDADGSFRKTSSISTMQTDPSHASGFNVLRFNATYRSGGVNFDDLAIRLYGNHGVSIFGDSDVDVPGNRVMQIRGKVLFQEVASEPQTPSSGMLLYLQGGSLKTKNSSGNIIIIN